MGQRRLFLLFLSAMSVSIIIMVIIYGLFIKDFDFTFNVKNPEMAPSPIDMFNQNTDSGEAGAPAKISTPDQVAEAETKKEDEAAEKLAEESEKAVDDIVPLEPQGDTMDDALPLPSHSNEKSPEIVNAGNIDASPSLHYVYLDGFSTKEAAEQAIQHLQDRNLVAQPYVRQHRGQIILQFGVFSDRANADELAQKLRHRNVYVKVD